MYFNYVYNEKHEKLMDIVFRVSFSVILLFIHEIQLVWRFISFV